MTAELPDVSRCPKCGAAVRFGDPWCTLCYTDLRPPAPKEPEPLPMPPPASPVPPTRTGPDPLTAPLEAIGRADPGVDGPSWPCGACRATNPMALDVCVSCGTPFLSGVREQEAPLLEIPGLGDITRHSRGLRMAMAGGAVLAVLVLTLLLGLLFR